MNNCCGKCIYSGFGHNESVYSKITCKNSNCPCHKPTDKETSGVFICRTKDTTGGEETHSACQKRIKAEGGKARCCYCVPHKDCEFVLTAEVSEDWLKGLRLRLDYCQEQNGLPYCKNCGLCFSDIEDLENKIRKAKSEGKIAMTRK